MKTSNPKAKTARRFWSILLSLVMVLTMLPTAALADEPLIGTFGIQVNTRKGGVAIPSPETFTFEITDRVESGTPKPLSDYGITVLDQLEVELTDFENTPRPSTTIRVQVDPAKVREDNGWTKESLPLEGREYFRKYLNLKQPNTAKPGWTCDTREMVMRIAYYPATADLDAELGIRIYESGDVFATTANFNNTYTSNIVSFPITKIVELGAGTAACPEETFSFKFNDNPFAYGITVLDPLEITADGTASEYTESFRLEIDPDLITVDTGWTESITGGNTRLEKSFRLTEINDGAPGWQYSDKTWVVIFTFTPTTKDIMIQSAASGTDAYGPIKFTNTYTYTEGRYEFPFTKVVKLGGNTAPGRQAFELEIFDARGVGSADGLYTATVETRGAGSYEGSLIISGPAEEVENLVNEDFYVREKNTGEANWTYSDAVWHVTPDPDNPGNFVIVSTTLQHSENGDYYVDAGAPADRMTFENTYTYNTSSGGHDDSGATIIVKKTDPAGTPLSGAVFALNNSRGDAVYEATSNSSGVARFTDVSNGTYTLVEQSAPEGYVMSEERYELEVRGSRVTMDGKTYSPVTFVNRRIAELNRKDHFPFLIGYADGTFGPARNMTRAEVTTMFARLLTEQIEADKTYTNTFNDVPSSYWAANYIGYMQQFGIVTGFSDGSFRPNAPVTRAQFAAIASRFEKLTEGTKSFTDVPSTYWAAKYINFAATRGWVTGYADGTFRPANPITRAEVAAVTCRLLERTADQAYVRSHLSQLRTFRDMSESHWAYWYAIEAANGHDYTKAGSGETWSRVHS
ncbi:S-layer homology domain-containing protein [Dysosmobacter sp. Phy]